MSSPSAPPEKTSSRDDSQTSEVSPRPALWRRLWQKTGLTSVVLMLMFKGALAPTIAIAAYQADLWADQYTTLGYLIAIMALLSLPIQPRAKFIQAILTSTFFVCVGAAVTLLQIRCTVTARQSTTPAGQEIVGQSGSTQSTQYSAAASTTSAVWLFITIWIANLVRSYRPQLMLPTVQYCIFTIVGSTYAPLFPSMAYGESFVRRLLITFLTGFAIGTGVCLFVFPITSRKVTVGQMGGMVGMLKKILEAHEVYMVTVFKGSDDDQPDRMVGSDDDQPDRMVGSAEAEKMHKIVTEAGALYGKLRLELSFARKEIAWGKWQPHDFSDIFGHLREILLPAFGLSTFLHIVQSAREQSTASNSSPPASDNLDAMKRIEREAWDEVIAISHEPYMTLKKSLDDGLDHILYVLEITKMPRSKEEDRERDGGVRPGNKGFTATLENDMKTFLAHRETIIQRWCESKGIEVPSTFWEDPKDASSLERVTTAIAKQKGHQQQLYLILYVEYLVHSVGDAILDMARYADSKVVDGTMTRSGIINPGWRRLKKLISSIWQQTDSDNLLSDDDRESSQICIGDSFRKQKDPEHLPPVTLYQKVTNHLRKLPEILSSPEAAFAFRAAIATMSIGVVAFLRQTWIFFLRERGLWALIMVAISMGAHSGQGVFGFAARIFGTCVAMVASIVIYYIGYKQPGAIIPVMFIYLMFGILFLVKNPKYTIVGIISMVTVVLIIGYELQAGKIGITLATSNGQPYYEIYLLGPYRLATVCIGLGAAFFWTYFPYPVTTSSTLRKDAGNALYLLANYYSCVHTTVDANLRSEDIVRGKHSPMARLEKARLRVLQKCVLMISRLREHSNFAKYQITFGGKFPKAKYDELIDSIARVFQYLSLAAYSTKTFAAQEDETEWLSDFRRFATDVNVTTNEVTSVLCLLAASLTNGTPLPPFIQVPKPYSLAQRMRPVDPEILSIKHVSEPCYAAFAVLEVASTLISQELDLMVRNVQDLVGEVDFSFHASSGTASDSSSVTEDKKGKRE